MTFAITAATVAVAGVGLSAASAAGAFSSKVDSWGPTPEELKATQYGQKIFNQGQQWQKMLDPQNQRAVDRSMERAIYEQAQFAQQAKRLQGLKREMNSLSRGQYYDKAADRAVNSIMGQTAGVPGQAQGLAAQRGLGSGAMMMGTNNAYQGIENAARGANVQGRMGYLSEVNSNRGVYGNALNSLAGRLDNVGQAIGQYQQGVQGMFGTYADRVQAAMGMMANGGQQAAQNQANRINAQVQNNIAANQAMGQIGGMMTSVGMMGMGGFGGAGGLSGASAGYDPAIASRVLAAGGSKINHLL